MSEKVCIVILTVWIIGLAVAFISGIVQDIKSAKFKDVYNPPTRKSLLTSMMIGIVQIVSGMLMLTLKNDMTGASGFGIVNLAAAFCFFSVPCISFSNLRGNYRNTNCRKW